jgi:prevent-host-death family protein
MSRGIGALTKVASGSYLGDVRSVGLKTLKNKLSEYVRLAAAGETILISDRDRVVAELVPPRETRSASLTDAVLAQAVRDGLLTPPLQAGGPLPEAPPVMPLDEVLTELSADRADR